MFYTDIFKYFVELNYFLFDKTDKRCYNHICKRLRNGGETIMDQIMEMLKNIDWEQVIATVKDIIAKIEASGIIDKAIAAVKDLIGMIAG